jgi:hypothetical protein
VTTYVDRSYQAGQMMGLLVAEQLMEGALASADPSTAALGFGGGDAFARMNGSCGCGAPTGQQIQDMQLLIELMAVSMLMRQLSASPAGASWLAAMMSQSAGGCGCRQFSGFPQTNCWGGQRSIAPWGDGGRCMASPLEGAISGGPSGQRIAACAANVGQSMCSVGRCYHGVKEAIREATGIQLQGGSACQAADQLAGSGRFREVSCGPGQLRNLPPGAVVVWGATGASPHGHISVALGNGLEASDHVSRQLTSLRGYENFRVFLPNS